MVEAVINTRASTAYLRIREAIIVGRYQPGARLHVHDLASELKIGPSPIREALNRLVSDGLVSLQDQRGFRVASLDLSDLDDLTDARCWANEAALRASIQRGGQEWEERLILMLHRLRRAPRLVEVETGLRGEQWESAHDEFHNALIGACGSSWMQAFCQKTSDAAARYRAISRSAIAGQRGDEEEHMAIAEAAIARNEDKAVGLLTEHLRRTRDLVANNWQR
ncbi:GntR family transcriptional regulator [Sphingosinicella soli]|uniref:DNA-binding GntR family transcriptional regulator n=1 Tax=Sphingosinicella soli TaxID=333708 RepID=A0A7W7B5M8_9SPHN|nr:GntR family transcriptional regulator [Sphingosinicella soli]MBB4633362.1 DNA-binding GntR family transcriptional regulator [Sphingosinicella soli]